MEIVDKIVMVVGCSVALTVLSILFYSRGYYDGVIKTREEAVEAGAGWYITKTNVVIKTNQFSWKSIIAETNKGK